LAGLAVNEEKSRSVVHTTADSNVFVVEIDTAFDGAVGIRFVSLLKIFRMRDGEVVLLRDYFSPDLEECLKPVDVKSRVEALGGRTFPMSCQVPQARPARQRRSGRYARVHGSCSGRIGEVRG